MLTAQQIKWARRDLLDWFAHNRRSFPWRETRDPYLVWIAETLLRMTFAAKVKPVFAVFVQRWPSVQLLARADPDDVVQVLRPLGLAGRGANLVRAAKQVVSDHLGQIPNERAKLLALPGVGPYTAGAVLSTAYSYREILVDRVSGRVYRRVFGLRGAWQNPADEELMDVADRLLPSRRVEEFNWAVLDLAASVCRPHPDCGSCPLARTCLSVA